MPASVNPESGGTPTRAPSAFDGHQQELIRAVEARIPNGRRISNGKPGGFMFSCPLPGHTNGDAHPSASYTPEADGSVSLKCQGPYGHEQDDIIAALGFTWEDRHRPGKYTNGKGQDAVPPMVSDPLAGPAGACPHHHEPDGEPAVTHDYTGILKSMSMRRWEWDDGCPACKDGICKVLRARGSTVDVWYQPRSAAIPLDADDTRMWTAEGGKAADALRLAGKRALAWPSASSRPTDEALGAAYSDADTVVLFGDKDVAGEALTKYLADALTRLGKKVQMVAPDTGWAPSADAANVIAPGVTAKDLNARLEDPSGMFVLPVVEMVDATPKSRGETLIEKWGSRRAADITPVPPAPLYLGRIEPTPGKYTLLHGPGNAGKGTLTASWIARATNDDKNVLITDYEDNVATEWVPRLISLGAVMDRVFISDPVNAGVKGPIWQHAEDLRELCLSLNVELVVIDSLHASCTGSSVMDDTTPDFFRRGVMRLPCPVLVIGHVTKVHEMKYTFGSVYWHNYARAAWSLSERGPDGVTASLTQRKDNGRPMVGSRGVTYIYGPNGMPVSVVDGGPTIRRVRDRVMDVLTDDGVSPKVAMTTKDVTDAVNVDGRDKVSQRSVLEALKGLSAEGHVHQSGAGNAHVWEVSDGARKGGGEDDLWRP